MHLRLQVPIPVKLPGRTLLCGLRGHELRCIAQQGDNNCCLSTRGFLPLVFATGNLDFRPCATEILYL